MHASMRSEGDETKLHPASCANDTVIVHRKLTFTL